MYFETKGSFSSPLHENDQEGNGTRLSFNEYTDFDMEPVLTFEWFSEFEKP
jgi:hypothetical protein